MTISIQNRRTAPRLSTARVRFFVKQICRGLGCAERNTVPELCIVLTGDARMRQLNKTWRQQDKTTDVLSFSQIEDTKGGWGTGAPEAQAVWGDVIISYDTAARQARDRGHTLGIEVQVLLVHGILHLLGHEHIYGGVQAQQMQAAERRLLSQLAAAAQRHLARRQ